MLCLCTGINLVDSISDKINEKINELVKDENERSIIKELLIKTGKYNKQTNPLSIKKEFQQLVDQYFPFEEKNNE